MRRYSYDAKALIDSLGASSGSLMILVASQRGGGRQLARHLMNTQDNENVSVHEVRGFVGSTVEDAFEESAALSKGTRCKQYLFSVSLSPPANEDVPTQDFDKAIHKVEESLNLTSQPRVVVFHEKHGRRHAHAVWSRIDPERMKAVNMPFYKERLNRLSKELYIENDWTLPKGFIERNHSNPLNFTRAQWEQAKRVDNHPHTIKSALRHCWKDAPDKAAFQKALKDKGYVLAKGDRRGYVAVDVHNQVYSLSRWLGEKKKSLKEKLGDEKALMSVDTAKRHLDMRLKARILGAMKSINTQYDAQRNLLLQQSTSLASLHQQERKALRDKQNQRNQQEIQKRAERLGKGLRGLWQRVTGQYQKAQRQNEFEALQAYQRDQKERDAIIFKQLEARRKLQERVKRLEDKRLKDIQNLQSTSLSHFDGEPKTSLQKSFNSDPFKRVERAKTKSRGLELG